MTEYIEKQAAIDAAREDGKKIPTLAIRIMHDIKAIPAADVVPVVRCKDCKFRDEDAFCTGRGFPCQLVPDDGFCDKGKKQKLQYADKETAQSGLMSAT